MIQSLEDMKSLEDIEDLLKIIETYEDDPNYEYEKMAISFITVGEYAYEVDSYFKPRSYYKTMYPEKNKITIEVLSYWKQRVFETSNDILVARYGDLVWNFHKTLGIKVENAFQCARLAIAGYISIVENNLVQDPFILNESILRALQLAKTLNQTDYIEKIQETMLELEKRITEDSAIGFWGFCFEKLILESSSITEAQRKSIITEIEGRLERLLGRANEKGEDQWHAIEYAAQKLITYYFRQNEKTKIKPVLMKLENSIDSSSVNSHLKGYRYDRLYKLYESVQILTEAPRLLVKIEEVAEEGISDLKEIKFTREVDKNQLEELIAKFTTGEIDLDKGRIACYFIPKIDEYEQRIKKNDATGFGIFQQLMAMQPINEVGLAMATLDMSDKQNRLAKEISQDFQVNTQFLAWVMEKFIETHSLDENKFIALLFNPPIHNPKMEPLLKVGIRHYLQKDYLSAAHVLIPYIEATLRNIIKVVGGNIYKPNKKGGFDAFLLSDILFSDVLEEVLGEDVIFYFKLVYNDVRGYNLRNVMAHGLVNPYFFNRYTVQLIIHTLIILSCLRLKEEKMD
ncbi:DUF4209 domain-containing protein [Bacillus cereus]|uniref:DUF4209 domain-containing protein n=1 Tax=Bacillus cereus TaxID=1396 RepID=UPI0024BEBABE|nr:DUF4209 domain-containing protein [Bacillus cereus]